MESNLQKFLEKSLESSFHLKALTGDASSRVYSRVQSQGQSYIVCTYQDRLSFDHFKESSFALLNKEIPVPKIKSASFPFMLMEDLGDNSLEEHFKENVRAYSQAVDLLLHFQKVDLKGFDFKKQERTFTKEKFFQEMTMAYGELSLLLKTSISTEQKDQLFVELKGLSAELCQQHQVPTHRDYHCRNLYFKDSQIYMIDYQDARMGPYLYDLVSLVEDPYAALQKSKKEELKLEYRSKSSPTSKDWRGDYEKNAIQRLFKACGSYAYLTRVKSTDRYFKSLRPALENLNVFLQNSNHYQLNAFVQKSLEKLLK